MYDECKEKKFCFMYNIYYSGLYCGCRCGDIYKFRGEIKRNYKHFPLEIKYYLKGKNYENIL
jgi:hypothetical protein